MKNIIFDLGGVLFNVDYNLTIEAFKKLGVQNFEQLYSQAKQSKLFDKFETGKITPKEFRTALKKLLPGGISDYDINKAWCAMLLNFPHERLLFLKKLKTKYRLFVLSNTNKIHIAEVRKILKNEHQLALWNNIFGKKYLSHQIGMRKPEREIYNLILKENKLKAAETLFIDDSEQNIEGAKKVGLKTFYLKKDEEVMDMEEWTEP